MKQKFLIMLWILPLSNLEFQTAKAECPIDAVEKFANEFIKNSKSEEGAFYSKASSRGCHFMAKNCHVSKIINHTAAILICDVVNNKNTKWEKQYVGLVQIPENAPNSCYVEVKPPPLSYCPWGYFN